MDASVEELTEQICEAEKFLQTKKGYHGILGIDKQNRYMHATTLVLGLLAQEQNSSGEVAAITQVLWQSLQLRRRL